MDSALTKEGVKMARIQRQVLLDARFLENYNIELILHSPLKRAQDTCVELFGDCGIPIQSHSQLYEKSRSEYFGVDSMALRAARVRQGLFNDYNAKNVVLVGHGKFFQELIGCRGTNRLENCEVFHCILVDASRIVEGQGTLFPGGLGLHGQQSS